MKSKEMKNPMLNELEDDVLNNVSGGANDARSNLENDSIKDETMLIIPIV